MHTPNELLQYLYRGGQYGYYWVKEPDGKKRTIWFPVDAIPDVPDGSYDIYFGVNPTRHIPNRIDQDGHPKSPHRLRAALGDLAATNCLFAEFDVKHYGGKQAMLDHINGLKQLPSVLVDSGGGYHAYWLLVHPYSLVDKHVQESFCDLQYRWIAYVGGDPDAKDLARVLRVPGTYNYKPIYPEPLEVNYVWADFDMPYELSELALPLPPKEQIQSPEQLPKAYTNNHVDHGRHWVTQALSRVQVGSHDTGRNATGFWLACQLRDDGVSLADAETVMMDYQRNAPKGDSDYTELEARKSLESAYSKPVREPARGAGNGRHAVTRQAVITHIASPTGTAVKGDAESNGHASKTANNGDAGQTGTAVNGDNAGNSDAGLNTWELVYLNFEKIRECYDNQEAGDADLLAAMYRGRVVYDHAEGAWYVWRGHFWERDLTGFVYRLVARRVSPQYLHASAEAQSKELVEVSKNLAKRAAALRNKKRMDNVLFLAARNEHLALKGDEWDANPWLLGCANGVVDLKTGTFRRGEPKDYIRAHSPVNWQGIDVPCQRWERFISEIFNDDPDIPSFVRRLLGFGASGLTIDHLFPILWGEGRNGKSTLLEVLGDVLGNDLATSSQADALMDAAKGGDGPKPFIFGLRGKRLVWASESNEGRRINEGLVKQLTGGDRLNVRTLHSKPVEFKPSHLLMLLTNHKPHINADGSAIWDRVYLLPFVMRFIDHPKAQNERKRDPTLKDTLQAEHSGILAWLVRGFLEYQRDGINPPAAIINATQAYREEEDTTGMFIAERCILDKSCEVKASTLYKEYTDWCKDSGINPMSITSFGKLMRKRFPARESHGMWYCGIGLAV